MHRPLGRAWRLVYPPLAAAGAAGCAGPLARRSLGAGSLYASTFVKTSADRRTSAQSLPSVALAKEGACFP